MSATNPGVGPVVNPNDQTVLSNQVMGAATFHSPWIPLTGNESFSYQAVWTGTPVGNFTLESSCDSAQNFAVIPTNPQTIAGSSIAAGGAGGSNTWAYNLGKVPFNWCRITYTGASGAGDLVSLTFNGK